MPANGGEGTKCLVLWGVLLTKCLASVSPLSHNIYCKSGEKRRKTAIKFYLCRL